MINADEKFIVNYPIGESSNYLVVFFMNRDKLHEILKDCAYSLKSITKLRSETDPCGNNADLPEAFLPGNVDRINLKLF